MEDWKINWNKYAVNENGELVDIESGVVVALYEYYYDYVPTSLREAIETLLRI